MRQLPFNAKGGRVGRKVLVRTDAAGATHDFLDWLHARKLGYSLGFTLPDDAVARLAGIPAHAWTAAFDDERTPRQGAWVAEATGVLKLGGWPKGMRVIVRKERPHPVAQLRFTDADGLRLTAFLTNTGKGQLADLELRHRRRARAEDRIRCAKATGLTNLPLHGFAHNQIWVAIVALAVELTAWTQMLALTDHEARRWEPKRLRLRLFLRRGPHRSPCPASPPPACLPHALGRSDPDRPPAYATYRNWPDQPQPVPANEHAPQSGSGTRRHPTDSGPP